MSLRIVSNDIKYLDVDVVVDATSILSCKDETTLRKFYKDCLSLGVNSLAIPLIPFGDSEFSREDGLMIVLDELNDGLDVFILCENLFEYDDLDAYLDGFKIEDSRIDYRIETPKELEDRLAHLKDTFSEYLMYLIGQNGLTNTEVYKRAMLSKKVFSKIKNDPMYHPNRNTALRLCVGAKLNMDQTKKLLARAGYALSPCDKTDIVFSYFIENKKYDIIELDIQLEKYGEHCIIF